ncbi:MAG: efflux RND transporter permease subunit [Gammaproteobacteria bacterium]|nr:efflux RND transporter permease subunit [Gammaproteobacteria bacterium]MBT8105411.1 efflux RND transporter permease subunit [Gammaproteobacteria bacterium]NNF49684.1 efflux RND transporter permease subunit [Woeseiaceae bacterium]NNK25425.1 efflux RND transporter permease subunit [Woeseiaceae bacterium]NNL63585.1 efflux RND transporter permease subunit [Woeseiaceae bacterium]
MIAWFARNSVAANLLMVTIMAGGLLAITSGVRLEIFPPSDPDTVNVSVPLRGATPEDVELGVAVRIEEAVKDLEGVDKITSRSVEGATRVSIEIDSGYEPRELLDDIKGRVDAINVFPADTEKPVISLAQRSWAVISVVVAGDYSEEEIRLYAEQVRDDLLRSDLITNVTLDSVRRYEVAIEASSDRLREFDITLANIAQAVRASSIDLSAGNIRTEGGDVLIRSKGQAYRRADFESIVVKTNSDGSIVRVGDVANVIDGFEEESLRTRFNGKFAAFIDVGRVGNQNAIDIADFVKEYITARQDALPVGMELSYWDDDSMRLKDRLGIMTSSAIQGSILVILLLALFLRPSVGLWVFLGIPISFLGAFIVMQVLDVSLNLMSAFGFIIVLGIVVDDAIVTGENVYAHIRRDGHGIDAAISGTKEVAIPVTFGVLTTMAAFMPLHFIEGRLGDIFANIPAVVIPVMVFSLIESKLILPAHLKHVRLHEHGGQANRFEAWQSRFADGFERLIDKYYSPALTFCLRHRYSTLATFSGVLVILVMLVLSGWTRFVPFPSIVGETATASLTMPVGTPFSVTNRHAEKIEAAARELQEKYVDPETGESMIVHMLATVGATRRSTGSHLARVQFETVPRQHRTIEFSMRDVTNEWRNLIGEVPGAESLTFRSSFFRAGDPIDVRFSGNSLETLQSVGDETKRYLATIPGVFEIADSLSDGKEELQIELSPQGHLLGLTRNEIVRQVGQAFLGLQAQRIQRGRDDVRVLVRYPIEERRTIASLEELLITAPDGRLVPLANVATVKPGRGPSAITRIDGYRVLNVTADVDKASVNTVVLFTDLQQYLDELLVKYPGITYSFEGEQARQAETFGSLGIGIVVVLFVIYCMLALPLKSYSQPLIVMSVIPFGIIGAVIGHWFMGVTLTILSTLGFMALIGVVVNDSLVLVDFVNQRHRGRGEKLLEAVKSAGPVRFRPVMLTSLTTFFGLTPLLMDQSSSAQFLVPMAISLAFGILFATAITLILVPTNLVIADDIARFFGRKTSELKGSLVADSASRETS